MNELKIFENPDFGQVRVVNINGEAWLVGKDVAEVLGYENQNRDIVRHVDEDDRMMVDGKTQYQNGIELGQRGGWLINVSGLYSLVLSSKLPTAKKFRRWVTSEVLPSIRKTGGYKVEAKPMDDMEILCRAVLISDKKIKALEDKIKLDAPKVDFYDSVANSESLLSFEKVAKLIAKKGLGRNKLIGWLRDLRLLRKTESGNVPYQQYVNKGYFKLVESNRVINGYERVFTTTYVTQKGLDYILKLSKYYEKE